MSIVSFVDDNSRLGKAYLERDYSFLNTEIMKQSDDYTFMFEEDGKIYAFNVRRNESLSSIYHDDFMVIRIILKDVETLHVCNQEENFEKLLIAIKYYMEKNPAYYNVRIPTHFVDLIKAYNKILNENIFCGGTVEWIGRDKNIDIKEKESISVFWADKEYIEKNKKRLLEISYESFKTYQGQYHISMVTSPKAGTIYEQWLEKSFDDYQNNVLVVTYDNIPISFVMYEETEFAVEAVVGAVDNKYRKYGAYRLMISTGINYACDINKNFVTSTQFDNFIVQGVWASLGLKPFYSIYNIHFDKRKGKKAV